MNWEIGDRYLFDNLRYGIDGDVENIVLYRVRSFADSDAAVSMSLNSRFSHETGSVLLSDFHTDFRKGTARCDVV